MSAAVVAKPDAANPPAHWPLQPGDPLPPPASDLSLDPSQWHGDWVAMAVVTAPTQTVLWPADHQRVSLCVGAAPAPDGAAAVFRDATGTTAQRWGAGLADGPQNPLLICLDPAGNVHGWTRLA